MRTPLASRPAGDLAPIVGRAYDLCAALYEHVSTASRAQRTLLGRVVLDEGLRIADGALPAPASRE